MSTFPADIWSLVTDHLLSSDVIHLLCTSRGVRLKVSQGLRKLEIPQETWPMKLFELCPHIDTFIAHSALEDWKCLSRVPRGVKNLSVGYIAGQNVPDFQNCNLRRLSVISPFISWSIINALPQSLTELVIQECRFLSDPLFDILPRNLQILSILPSEKVGPYSSPTTYESTSYITDMALKNLPPSLMDVEIHSTCPFTELGLKLIASSDLQLRKLKLSPTYFKSQSLVYLPRTLIEIDFGCPIKGSELPLVTVPGLESLILRATGSFTAYHTFWSQLPASLTRLTLPRIFAGEIGFPMLGLFNLVSLEIEALGGVYFATLPRSLISLHMLSNSYQVASDDDVQHLPSSLTKLIYPAALTVAIVPMLPDKLRVYSFKPNGSQYTIPMDVVRASMLLLSDNQDTEKMSITVALECIKQSIAIKENLGPDLQMPVVLFEPTYRFTEEENAKITELKVSAAYLGQSIVTGVPATFPTHTTRLTIGPPSRIEHCWYTSRCIFPDSLTELDAVGLRLFIRRDSPDETADESLFGDLAPRKQKENPDKLKQQRKDETEDLTRLKPASEIMMLYEPLALPQGLTKLNIGRLMFPEILPSTLTDLSFEATNNPALLWILDKLPKSVKKLVMLVDKETYPTRWQSLLGISQDVLPYLENLYDTMVRLELKFGQTEHMRLSQTEESSLNPKERTMTSWLRDGFDSTELLTGICIWSSSGYSECPSITMMTYVPKPAPQIKSKIMPLASPNFHVRYRAYDLTDWRSRRNLDRKPKLEVSPPPKPVPKQKVLEPKKHFHERKSVKIAAPPPCDPAAHPMDALFTDENFPSQPHDSLLTLRLHQNKALTQTSFEKYLPSSLTVLWVLENQNISDETIPFFPQTITELVLGSKILSDACIRLLPTQLRILRLHTDLLTDTCIPDLPRSLISLTLPRDCRFSDTYIGCMPPALERLSLPGNNVLTDLAIGRLPRSLLALNLYANTQITNGGIIELPPKLQELWLEANRSITDACFTFLPRTLMILCIGSIQASPFSLAQLPPYLYRLHVGSDNLPENALANLSPSLSRLRLGSTNHFTEDVYSSLPLLQWDAMFKRYLK